MPDLDWDKTYLEFIPKALATKTTLEYYKVLMQFCAKLKDNHTNVFLPDEVAAEFYGRLAITTRLIENKDAVLDAVLRKLREK